MKSVSPCRGFLTRDGQVSAEQDTDPRLAAQGLVKLIPPPCESHGGGIQLDEPFWFSGVCAVRPSLRRRHFSSHLLVQGEF